ncbi:MULTISPECIES: nuclear transport factor 2 family protein [unclassified Acidisoma]|jgi:uncharacterized protein (TIGR02246 family)|uniref:YybH family protein n=1 Tax=unclassified Acidisoma TaxID=2634065 RepID=UPI00131E1139|nr:MULTISPECIES: nuclear transport factor 2 family protein [unclassified Acidisoma]
MSDDWVQAAVEVQKEWKAAFEARDLQRLGDLYAEKTAFYGSTAAFYDTPDGVRTYFTLLPPSYKRCEYAVPNIVRLGPEAMGATGEVMFYREDDGKEVELPFRMTHVLVREKGRWKIATHHASPRPAH